MSKEAVRVYQSMMHLLWRARWEASELRETLNMEEEALRAGCLQVAWEAMSGTEQSETEKWIEANKWPLHELASDGWPKTPRPPTDLRVVPVWLPHEGTWAWRQGDPEHGYRYRRADHCAIDDLLAGCAVKAIDPDQRETVVRLLHEESAKLPSVVEAYVHSSGLECIMTGTDSSLDMYEACADVGVRISHAVSARIGVDWSQGWIPDRGWILAYRNRDALPES